MVVSSGRSRLRRRLACCDGTLALLGLTLVSSDNLVRTVTWGSYLARVCTSREHNTCEIAARNATNGRVDFPAAPFAHLRASPFVSHNNTILRRRVVPHAQVPGKGRSRWIWGPRSRAYRAAFGASYCKHVRCLIDDDDFEVVVGAEGTTAHLLHRVIL